MKTRFLTFVLLLTASPAVAASIGLPTPGYVYFHRAGTDMAAHNAAVEACAADASVMLGPYIGNTDGLIGSLLQGHVDDVNFLANVENCMVANGWDIVRLNDDEGKKIAALDQAAQAAMLAPWVFAETPHGEIVRRYQPIGKLDYAVAGWTDEANNSLSLTSDADGVKRAITALPARTDQSIWQTPEAVDDISNIAPGATLIVVRATTIAPAQGSLFFAQLDKPEERTQSKKDSAFIVPTPTRLFWSHGSFLEKLYVFVVPPGHWRIVGANGVSLCQGAPAFDVAPGEAIFAGTYNAAQPFAVDIDLQPAKAMLGNAEFAQRLKPAQYTNGEKYGCGHVFATLFYKMDLSPDSIRGGDKNSALAPASAHDQTGITSR